MRLIGVSGSASEEARESVPGESDVSPDGPDMAAFYGVVSGL